ncbi:MAG: rRNA pseudouridine synthase [Firmicutes bacterium]|nr:rRNA pseudouridine synthase [Bacillota bacterium]
MSAGRLERLHKVLAAAGVASRRRCEEMIAAGRVTVNGRTATVGQKIDRSVDEVTVDGRPCDLTPAAPVCVMLNKPQGCVSTRRDTHGRKTVMDIVGRRFADLYPVGRLDYDTEGLLLLTNDGELAHRLMHPAGGVPKTYEATVRGVPDAADLEVLSRGVPLEEGRTAPASVRVKKRGRGMSVIEITVHQGWKRQVRRMLRMVGHPVLRLKRTGYGFLRLGDLKPGEFRLLDKSEMEMLREYGGDRRRGGRMPDTGRPNARGRDRT